MVAIVSGNGLGLLNSSAAVLGAQGQFGAAGLGKAAVTVNLANGNLVLQEKDDFIAARDIDLALTRTYNAQDLLGDDVDGNGVQWRLGIIKQVKGLTGSINASGSSITRLNGDGSSALYRYDAQRAAYISQDGAGAYQVIVRDTVNNQWIWRDDHFDASGRFETYGDDGLILNSGDVNGVALTYSYQNGRLQSVRNASQDVTSFIYDAQQLLREISTRTASNVNFTRVRYEYDAQQRLSSVSTDLTPRNSLDTRTYTTHYTYDGASMRLRQVWQDDGSLIHLEYDSAGRVKQFTDALRNTTVFDYSVAGQTKVTGPERQTSIYRYDGASQLIEVEVVQDGPAANNQITKFAYDAQGNVSQTITAGGLLTRFGYDANGNRIFEQDAAGNTVQRQYDAQTNLLLSETRYRLVDPDGTGPQTASGALTSRMVYDSAHRLRYHISAEGRVTEHRYNSLQQRNASLQYQNNLVSLAGLSEDELSNANLLRRLDAWKAASNIDYNAISRQEWTYDARGQVESETRYASVNSQGVGMEEGKTRLQFTYDIDGTLLQKIDGNGNLSSYAYDGLGRLLSSTDANAQSVINTYVNQYAGPDSTAAFENSQQVTGRLQAGETLRFDAMGRVISQTQGSASSTETTSTRYTYDNAGRLRTSENAFGQKQYWFYDVSGRKIAEVDSDGSLTESFYNANNQLSRVTRYATRINPNVLVGDGSSSTESLLANLRATIASAQDRSNWNVYDQAGRLSETVDALGGVTRMHYDGLSRLVQVTAFAKPIDVSQLGNAPASVQPSASTANDALQDRISRSFYDGDNLLIATLDADGYLTKMRYNASAQLIERTAYAKQFAIAERTKPLEQLLVDENAAKNIRQYQIYNGKQELIASIDGEGYLTSMRYDAAGNLQSRTRFANRVALKAGASWQNLHWQDLLITTHSEDQTTSYTYTKLNQLRDETAPDASVTRYSYDQYGLLTNVQRGLSTAEERGARYRYDSLGRKVGELSAEGAQLLTQRELKVAAKQAQPYTKAELDALWANYGLRTSYNSANQRTSVQDQLGHTTFYYYDGDGRLTHSINANGEVQENRYDAFGAVEQITQFAGRISTTLMEKLQAEQNTASKLLSNGQLTGELLDAITLLRSDTNNSVQSIRYDRLGRVEEHTDALNFRSQTDYNRFGEVRETRRQLGNLASDTPNSFVATSFVYDNRGNLTKTVPFGNAALTTRTDYDAFGRAVVQVDGLQNRRVTDFDRLGRVLAIKDPLTPAAITTYDAFGRVLTQIDANQHKTSYQYNRVARSVTITTPENITHTTTRNRFGETVSIDDGSNVIRYEYDRAGRLLKTTDNIGQQSQQVYDSNGSGRLMQSINANGIVTQYEYDAVNRVLKRIFNALDSNNENGGIQVTSYSYDSKGQVITSTDARNIVTRTEYFKNGQVKAIIVDPSTANYQGLNLTTRFEYDSRGNKIKLTEPNGNITQYSTSSDGLTSSVVVDPNGLALQSTLVRDANGNVVMRSTGNGTNLQSTYYAYDANRRLAYEMDAEGSVTAYAYDVNNRVSRITHYAQRSKLLPSSVPYSKEQIAASLTPDAARDTVQRTLYDKDGRVMASIAADGGITQAIQFDAAGRVLEQIRYAKALPLALVKSAIQDGMSEQAFKELLIAQGIAEPAKDQHQRFIYDARGNLTASASLIQIQDGQAQWSVVSQRFDGNGNLMLRRAYQAVLFGSVTGSAPTAIAITSFITANDVKSAQDTAKDAITAYAYDAANRLLGTATAQANLGGTSQQRTWAIVKHRYDANGNLLATRAFSIFKQSLRGDAELIKSMWVDPYFTSQQTRYVYDAANRLILSASAQTANNSGILQWAVVKQDYDAQGNLIARRQFANPVAMHSDVDDWSNLLTKVQLDAAQDRLTQFAYDGANRLSLTLDAVGAATRTLYNAQGDAVQSIAYATLISNRPAVLKADMTITKSTQDRSTRTVFDQNHRAVLKIDALGYVSQQRYNALGQLESSVAYATALSGTEIALLNKDTRPVQVLALLKTSPQDRITRQVLDAAGRVRFSVDALGFFTEYHYDALGQLVQTRLFAQALPTPSTASLDEHIIAAIASQEADAALAAQIRTQRFGYDAKGQRISSTDAMGHTEFTAYDALGNKIRFTNKLNAVWTYDYDMAGHMIQINSPPVDVLASKVPTGAPASDWGQNAPIHLISIKTVFEYDVFGQVIRHTEAAGLGEQEKTTRYSYDLMGRQTVTKKEIQTLSNNVAAYSASSTLLTSEAFNARSAYTPYSFTTVAYNAFGDAVSSTDSGDRMAAVTRFKIYDQRGQVAYDIEPVINFAYQKYGSYITGYQRDAFGNVTQSTRYGEAVVDAHKQTTQVGMRALLAQRSSTEQAQDRVLTSKYDALGRVSKVIEAATLMYDQSSTTGSYFIFAARTKATQYNGFGEVTQESVYAADAQGTRITAATRQRTYYNNLGQKSAQLSVLFDNRAYLTQLTYDAAGNLRSQTEFASAFALSGNWQTSALPPAPPPASQDDRTQVFGYDKNNRQISQTRVNVRYHDAVSGAAQQGDLSRRIGYDAVGQQISSSDELGNTSFTDFDALGRVIATGKVGASANAPTSSLTVMRLDALGNTVLKIDYAQGAISAQNHRPRALDAQDRLTAMRYDNQGKLLATLNSELHQQHFAYDLLGRLQDQWSAVTDVNTDINSDGQLGSIKRGLFEHRMYDELGRLIAQETPCNLDTNEAESQRTIINTYYNAFGEITLRQRNLPTKVDLDFARYDKTGKTWLTNAGDGVDRITLYNAQGLESAQVRSKNTSNAQVLRSAANLDAALAQANLVMSETRYDALGHVVDQDLAGERTTYVLQKDAAGNWQKVALTGSQSAPQQYIVLANPPTAGDAAGTINARFRIIDAAGNSQWQDAGSRLQVINGYTVFNTAGLATGSYQYSASMQAANMPSYEISSGMLAIQVGANQQQSIQATSRQGSDHLQRDRWGNVVRKIDLRNATWATDLRYNDQNQIIEQTNAAVDIWDTAQGRSISQRTKTLTQYDAAGHVLATVDAKGNTNQWRYNALGYVVQEIHADGGRVDYTVDVFGQRTQTRQQINANNYLTNSYRFDRLGRMVQHWTQPLDVYTVDHATMKETKHSGATIVDEYVYDERGQRVSVANYSTHNYQKTVTLRQRYDLSGNLIRSIDALGNETRMAYDSFNHKIEQMDANSVVQWRLNRSDPKQIKFVAILRWQVDAYGRTLQHTDLQGRQTTSQYDAMGRMIAQIGSNGSTVKRVMTYDDKNNLTTLSETDSTASASTPARISVG